MAESLRKNAVLHSAERIAGICLGAAGLPGGEAGAGQ